MARIKHIAVFANDGPGLADFYKNTFGLKEVFRHTSAEGGGEAIYLSDGYINMAILPARGKRPEGIDHFGFHVDNVEETAQAAEKAGATQGPKNVPRDGRFAECFICDPIGQRIDLSVKGWRTS
jgi:catechol 2,3-dioxygenase-like lactoylglutathione lyase family enzyme